MTAETPQNERRVAAETTGRANWRTWLSVSVHGYTILGGVLGVAAVLAAAELSFERAFLFLVIALVIDVTDGRLARAVGVTEYTPNVDGERLDVLVDFLTFVVAPVVIATKADLLPRPSFLWVGAIVASSLVRFARRSPKSLGFYSRFPNVWNILVFYSFYFGWSAIVVGSIAGTLVVLMALPGNYPHPSKHPTRRFHLLIAAFAAVPAVSVALGALPTRPWLLLSLAYPGFYVGQVVWLTVADVITRRRTSRPWFLTIIGNYQRAELLA
jgi:phosphatidylcholine synthase